MLCDVSPSAIKRYTDATLEFLTEFRRQKCSYLGRIFTAISYEPAPVIALTGFDERLPKAEPLDELRYAFCCSPDAPSAIKALEDTYAKIWREYQPKAGMDYDTVFDLERTAEPREYIAVDDKPQLHVPLRSTRTVSFRIEFLKHMHTQTLAYLLGTAYGFTEHLAHTVDQLLHVAASSGRKMAELKTMVGFSQPQIEWRAGRSGVQVMSWCRAGSAVY
jgi:hypothetical protein